MEHSFFRQGKRSLFPKLPLSLLCAALSLLSACEKAPASVAAVRIDRIQELGELVVLRVYVQDVMVGSEKESGSRMVFVIKGSALYTVDIGKSRFENGVLILPLPEIRQEKVDNSISEIHSSEKNILYTSDALDRMRQTFGKPAQDRVRRLADSPAYQKKAKEQTETLLKSMFPAEKVSLRWDDGSFRKEN